MHENPNPVHKLHSPLTWPICFALRFTPAWLLCGFAKTARGQSTTGRRLPRRQYGGRAKRSLKPHQRHLQYGGWFVFAPEHYHQQFQYWHWCWDALKQRRRLAGHAERSASGFRKYSHRCRRTFFNTTGNHNTSVGDSSLGSNDAGNSNVAIGDSALITNFSGNNNTAIGASALGGTTGSGNIAVGFQAGAAVGSSDNVIAIGSPGDDVDNSCFIGNIRDAQTQNADAITVVVDSAGQLGTVSSSRRFKKEIAPMDKASEAVLALKPVTFHYNSDKTGTPQFGLIAEEVAELNPDLVVRDKDGEIYTVRYDAVNAMLLNEFLKEHRTVQQQGATITRLQKQIETLTVGLQKISAQLQMNKPAPQTASLPAVALREGGNNP